MVALVRQSNIIPFPEKQRSNEWYTPAKYIEAARRVMGSIDLDPASCALANETVKASRYYTKEDDGLSKPWHGSVWLNPPYGSTDSKSNMAIWSHQLIERYYQGRIEQAFFLATGTPERKWFQPLWEFPICFPNHQIVFKQSINPLTGKSQDHHPYGTCFVYLGPNEAAFIREFSAFGTIAKAIAGPRRDTMQASLWEVQA